MLALLVTARQHRQRGAGSMLVKWGIELSEKTGLPCYLQVSEQGRRLYQHHGFEDIGTVEFNLSEYGLDGIEKMTEMTRGSWSKTPLSKEVASYRGSTVGRDLDKNFSRPQLCEAERCDSQ